MRKKMTNIKVALNSNMLVSCAADLFVASAQSAIKTRNRFSVALSGGSTPRELYARLATAEYSTRINWKAVHLFWGDERCVPPDHADSNYRMSRESLRVPIPEENIHRIYGELAPEFAAKKYENELRSFFKETPRFDLILLGLGDDGHTASLFPDSPALKESTRWAVGVEHTTPPPPLVPRVTLTFPVINNAREIVFLVTGRGKAARVSETLGSARTPCELPACAVHPANGNLSWLLDQSAAILLEESQQP